MARLDERLPALPYGEDGSDDTYRGFFDGCDPDGLLNGSEDPSEILADYREWCDGELPEGVDLDLVKAYLAEVRERYAAAIEPE